MNHLLEYFPNLRDTHFIVTSPQDISYNCIAWAAAENDCWWWPDPMFISSWPDSVSREVTLDAFVTAFALTGYSPCENGDHEIGFEKVAIFLNSEKKPTHMARQLNSGKWTSKLGELEDIEHDLAGVEGDVYGKAAQFLKRSRRD
jgi:hypothetical protein